MHFKLFGKHIYVTSYHMRRKYTKPQSQKRKNQELRTIIKCGGLVFCELCHQATTTPTIHHIYEVSQYPEYRSLDWNHMILCPNCHMKVHIDKDLDRQIKQSKLNNTKNNESI